MKALSGPSVEAKACTLSTSPPLPAQHATVYIIVQLVELTVRVTCSEVVAPSAQYGIQFLNQFFHVPRLPSSHIGKLVHPVSEPLHRFR